MNADINQIIKQFHIDRTRSETFLKHQQNIDIPKYSDKLLIPILTGLKNIVISDIFYIKQTADNYKVVNIYYGLNGTNTVSTCLSIKQLNKILDKQNFFQANRSTICNFNYLSEIETKDRNCILCKDENFVTIKITKRKLQELRELNIALLLNDFSSTVESKKQNN
ncbi:MAG: hypothetical protein HC905_19540 [Bacteroidales bacterium]|nr:hypothetical protein [Bacteroidales bacterium]